MSRRSLLGLFSGIVSVPLSLLLFSYLAPAYLDFITPLPQLRCGGVCRGPDPRLLLLVLPMWSLAYLIDYLVFRGRPLGSLIMFSIIPALICALSVFGGGLAISHFGVTADAAYAWFPFIAYLLWFVSILVTGAYNVV